MSAGLYHLQRAWYRTDADGNYVGAFSAGIPARMKEHIVAVRWLDSGVEVTYLLPGEGPVRGDSGGERRG